MPTEYIEVQNLKELNSALNNKKTKLIVLKPEKTKSFDLQAFKKAASSGKEFCVLFSDFLEASPLQRKKLFIKHFLLFKIAKKAGLEIKVLSGAEKELEKRSEQELDFFGKFLVSKSACKN